MEDNRKIFEQLAYLETEQINSATENIDIASTIEILRLINDEDKKVALAVEAEIDNISKAVDIIYDSFNQGGRLFYFGAGTSGRLGIVDASECPPTYGTQPELVQGVIAGGPDAVFRSQEGAEDSKSYGAAKVEELGINNSDVVCGIAASGRTPYVLGAIEKAREIGCRTIFITTVSLESARKNGANADVMICPVVGPEVVAGSTRMKSGTAQKLVLNMLTTSVMIKLGKTFNNVMVDLQPTNQKLKERAKKTLMSLSGLDYSSAEKLLIESDWHLKTALVAQIGQVSIEMAKQLITKAEGKVKVAIDLAKKI